MRKLIGVFGMLTLVVCFAAAQEEEKEKKKDFPRPRPGQVIPEFLQERLNLTADQKKELEALQKEVDTKLAKILTAEQKQMLKEFYDRFGKFGKDKGKDKGPPKDKDKDKGPPPARERPPDRPEAVRPPSPSSE